MSGWPISAIASAITQAVTPEPQLATSGLLGSMPLAAMTLRSCCDRLQRAVGIEKRRERQRLRRGDVAGAKTGARLGHAALVALCRARIDDLNGGTTDRSLDLVRIAHQRGVEPRREVPLGALHRRHILDFAALGLPLLEAAVENAHVLVPHDAEHPPHARRRVEALAVVDDDAHAVADAHLLHPRREHHGRRQHVRQRVRLVRDRVDVEEQRAGNVPRIVLRLRVAPGGRQMQRAVEHDDVGGIEMCGEPIGLDHPLKGHRGCFLRRTPHGCGG